MDTKMIIISLKILGACAAGASAFCWIRAALIRTPLPMAYLSGPPKEVSDRISNQSWWNAMAAWGAAVAAICQALTTYP
jgi:hypothetical protein